MNPQEEHQARMMSHTVDEWGEAVLNGTKVEVPTWQALDVVGKPQGSTIEQTDCTVRIQIPTTAEILQAGLKPNMPWAEEQFQERVAGQPLNPGETYKNWPWFHRLDEHKEQGQFSHTYMERYWPKRAGEFWGVTDLSHDDAEQVPAHGIHFDYGDLNDVVNLLAKQPTTRQAYLPVFFPEDTGAVHGERIPCSLGYLFLMRENKLNITYYIRSCDFYRHFRDDVYMTARLCQWVLEECRSHVPRLWTDDPADNYSVWDNVTPGRLTMHIGSLHVFEGDLPKLRREYGE